MTDPDTSPESDLLAPPWLFEHVAECIRKGHATESMAGNVDCLRSGFAALSAERAALKSELAEAVKLLRGSDAAFERIGYAADSIARESIRAFLARHQKGADT